MSAGSRQILGGYQRHRTRFVQAIGWAFFANEQPYDSARFVGAVAFVKWATHEGPRKRGPHAHHAMEL